MVIHGIRSEPLLLQGDSQPQPPHLSTSFPDAPKGRLQAGATLCNFPDMGILPIHLSSPSHDHQRDNFLPPFWDRAFPDSKLK